MIKIKNNTDALIEVKSNDNIIVISPDSTETIAYTEDNIEVVYYSGKSVKSSTEYGADISPVRKRPYLFFLWNITIPMILSINVNDNDKVTIEDKSDTLYAFIFPNIITKRLAAQSGSFVNSSEYSFIGKKDKRLYYSLLTAKSVIYSIITIILATISTEFSFNILGTNEGTEKISIQLVSWLITLLFCVFTYMNISKLFINSKSK